MTPHSSSGAHRASRHAPPESYEVNPTEYPGYGYLAQTPLPVLGCRVPHTTPVKYRAPLLMTPVGNNFAYSSPQCSPFVTPPSQPSPSEQRKRAISFGPKPAMSHHQSVTSSFRTRTLSRPDVSLPDGQKPSAASGHSSTAQASSSSNSRTQRSNFQSTRKSYDIPDPQKVRVATGHSSAASSSFSNDSCHTHTTPNQIEQSPMLRDIALVAAVAAASADHREFPWYGVWSIAIRDHMFYRCHTSTTACNLVPQHALQREYDPSSSESISSKTKQEWVIPDFALVLHCIRLSSNGPARLMRQRVIVIVENKPSRPKHLRRSNVNPFTLVHKQVHRQVLFSFASDPTSNTVGVIITFGALLQYGEIHRPADKLLSSWSEAKDPSFGTEEVRMKIHVPSYLKKISGEKWFTFNLMDRNGKSAMAFRFIANRVKEREGDFWGLPLPQLTRR